MMEVSCWMFFQLRKYENEILKFRIRQVLWLADICLWKKRHAEVRQAFVKTTKAYCRGATSFREAAKASCRGATGCIDGQKV